jgi:hypothetical protein
MNAPMINQILSIQLSLVADCKNNAITDETQLYSRCYNLIHQRSLRGEGAYPVQFQRGDFVYLPNCTSRFEIGMAA